jgi:hypothetical protein
MVRKAQMPRIVMTRMPEGIHAFLRKEAKLNSRSVNAEIVHRLTQSMVHQSLMDTSRQQAEMAANTAAERVAERLLERLDQHLAMRKINEKSLLGGLFKHPKTEGKS